MDPSGLTLIFIINILRIIMIVLSSHYKWERVYAFNAHTSFNVLTYAAIVVMMAFFVRRYKKIKEHYLNKATT